MSMQGPRIQVPCCGKEAEDRLCRIQVLSRVLAYWGLVGNKEI